MPPVHGASRNVIIPEAVAMAGSPLQLRGLPAAFKLLLAIGLAVVLAILAAYTIACIRFAHIGSDQSWLLYAASRVLDGLSLDGPGVVESNPPLIVWVSTVPDMVARWLHASPLFVLKVMVVAMAFGSATWCVRLLRSARLASTPLLLCLSFFAITAAEVSRDFLPYGQFSQREQFVLLLALPYLLYSCCSWVLKIYPVERIALGIAAGIGFCLKPQQVLILISFELFFLLYTRSLRRLLRPELLTVVTVICFYVVVVALATPYFGTIVPRLRDTYWAFADVTKGRLVHIAFLNGKTFLALLLAVGTYRFLKFPAAPLALLAASLGAGLAYVQQGMAWEYHLLPASALVVCAIGWIALDLLSSCFSSLPERTPRRTLAVAALALALFALLLPSFFARERRQLNLADKYRGNLFHLVGNFPTDTSFYVFSTSNGDFFEEVVRGHLVWASRYNHLWMLPAIAENERALAGGPPARRSLSPDRLNQLSDKLRSDLAEDFRVNQPQFVIVEHCNQVSGCQGIQHYDFDMLQWFLKSPTFAIEWSHYQRSSGEEAFDVYTRKASAN